MLFVVGVFLFLGSWNPVLADLQQGHEIHILQRENEKDFLENLPLNCADLQKNYPTQEIDVRTVLRNKKSLGTIVFSDGQELALTGSDLLWFARMLWGEATRQSEEHIRLVGWTAIQRKEHLTYYQNASFTQFLLNFSQPINPDFLKNGHLCKKSGKKRKRRFAAQCIPSLYKRRLRIRRAQWNQIPLRYRKAALEIFLGATKSPNPLLTNFARHYGDKDCKTEEGEATYFIHPENSITQHVFCYMPGEGVKSTHIRQPSWLHCESPISTD